MKYLMMCLTTLLTVSLCLWSPGAVNARRSVILAEDYPYAAIFMCMTRRGELDHAANTGVFAPDLETLVSGGYTAYHFPPGFNPGITYDDDNVTITSQGKTIHSMNHDIDPLPYGCGNPHGELYTAQEQFMPEGGDPAGEWGYQTVKAWKFRGAEWLDAGYGMDAVRQAQRFDRITQHLIMASLQYGADNYGMPEDLTDLEDYVGVPRNEACWVGLNLVDSPDAVDLAAGNLFTGWSGDNWVVKCNLGPEVYTEVFKERDGVWTYTQHGALIWY